MRNNNNNNNNDGNDRNRNNMKHIRKSKEMYRKQKGNDIRTSLRNILHFIIT